MIPQWIIEKKRDGFRLSGEEIRFLLKGYTEGTIPDYQMSAFAMAVCFRGMDAEETAVFTDAMMRSGAVMDLSGLKIPKADKHSTGGVGDKVSLALAPLVACCGVAVPMLSGRGLGITGGTLDKLESIPGYRTDLSAKEFRTVLEKCGCSITGQTPELVPADRKLYALRDVTGTVPCIPLISASIMSKKLAEGADSLVLDVKWGKGAFMKSMEEARSLARSMVEIGRKVGRGMTAVITDMNQPLGRSAGNAVEVGEVVDLLKGGGPEDLAELTVLLGAHMLVLSGSQAGMNEARIELEKQIDSGRALAKFEEMVALQGGETGFIRNPEKLPRAKITEDCTALESGFVTGVDADSVGRACVVLGAGRRTVTDRVDHSAGITRIVKIGEKVDRGQPLARLHANDGAKLLEARRILDGAFQVSDDKPCPLDLVVETIE